MIQQTSERLERLILDGMCGLWIVNPDTVNLDDLVSEYRPGKIIRAYDVNDVRFIPSDTKGLEGCIAGWISEEEVSNG